MRNAALKYMALISHYFARVTMIDQYDVEFVYAGLCKHSSQRGQYICMETEILI